MKFSSLTSVHPVPIAESPIACVATSTTPIVLAPALILPQGPLINGTLTYCPQCHTWWAISPCPTCQATNEYEEFLSEQLLQLEELSRSNEFSQMFKKPDPYRDAVTKQLCIVSKLTGRKILL